MPIDNSNLRQLIHGTHGTTFIFSITLFEKVTLTYEGTPRIWTKSITSKIV